LFHSLTHLIRWRRRIILTTAAVAATLVAGTGVAAAADQSGDDGGVHVNIVGGADAVYPYPGMAAMWTSFEGHTNFCGAVVIAPRWAYTNAHCVTNLDLSPAPASMLQLRVGSTDRTTGGTVTGVDQVLPHASWDWATGPNPVYDLALLHLATAVPGPFLSIPNHLDRPGAPTRILGWGLTAPDGTSIPTRLQQLDTRLLPAGRCAAAGITAGEICVASPHSTGACNGDSGGPAMQKVTSRQWQLIGGASREASAVCAQQPTVYTDIVFYRHWIAQVMRTGRVPVPQTGQEPTPPQLTSTTTTRAVLHWAVSVTK
jgi:secreted trypsin-like serine protease